MPTLDSVVSSSGTAQENDPNKPQLQQSARQLVPDPTDQDRDELREAFRVGQLREAQQPQDPDTLGTGGGLLGGSVPRPSDGVSAAEAAKGVFIDTPRAAIGGVLRGTNKLAQGAARFSQWWDEQARRAANLIPGVNLQPGSTTAFDVSDTVEIIPETRIDDLFGDDEAEDQFVTARVIEPIARWIPSFVAVTIATGGSGTIPALAGSGVRTAVVKAGARIGIEGLRGAVADMLVFDAYEETIAKDLESLPLPRAAQGMLGMISVDEDDSIWEAKFKQGMEGFLLGATLDAAVATTRAYRGWRKLKAGRVAGRPVQQLEEQAEGVLRQLEEAEAAQQASPIRELPNGRGFEVLVQHDRTPRILGEIRRTDTVSSQGFQRESVEIDFIDPETGSKGTVTGNIAPEEPELLRDFHVEIEGGKNTLGHKNARDLGIELREQLGVSEVEGIRVSGVRKESGAEGLSLNIRRSLPERRNTRFRTRAEVESFAARQELLDKPNKLPKGKLDAQSLARVRAVAQDLQQAPVEQWPTILRNNLLNINYTQSAEEARSIIHALAEVMPRDFVNAKTAGAKPIDRVSHMAANMYDGMSQEEVVEALSRKFGETVDLDQAVVANGMYFEALGFQIDQLSRLSDSFPEDGKLVKALGAALDHAHDVAVEMVGISSNIGRALQAHQRIGAALEASGRQAGHVVSGADAPRSFKGMTPRLVRAYARKIRMAEGNMRDILREARVAVDDVVGTARKTKDPTRLDKIQELRINGMVSGPKTITTNVLSGMLRLSFDPLAQVWAGMRNGNTELTQEGIDLFVGNFLSVRDGLRAWAKGVRNGEGNLISRGLDAAGNVGESLRTGLPVRDPLAGVSTGLEQQAIKGLWGTFVNLARRPLVAGDEIIKTIAGRSKVRARSLRIARQNPRFANLKPQGRALAFAKQIEDDLAAHVNDKGAFTNMTALDYARDVTFTQTLGKNTAGGAFQEMLQKVPILKVIHPFHRISVNLFRHAWAHTPVLGQYAKQNAEDLAAGGERAAVAQARMEMGAAVWALGGYLAVSGQTTGGGPRDASLRRDWLAAGNKPYHFTIGSKQFDLRRLYPFSAPLMMAADFVQISDYLDEDKGRQIPLVVMSGVASSLTSPTFMRGISDAMDAFTGDEHAMSNFVNGMAGSIVPFSSLLRGLNPDDVYRETQGVVDHLMAGTPILSEMLEPDRNVFGEQIMRPPGFLNRTINPLTPAPAANPDDPMVALVELGRSMPMPSPSIADGFIDLRDRNRFAEGSTRPKRQSPYDRMLELQGTNEINGKTMREELGALVNSREWEEASSGAPLRPGGLRHLMASRLIEARYDAAWGIVLDEYPSLQREWEREMSKNAAALEGPDRVREVDALIEHIYKR